MFKSMVVGVAIGAAMGVLILPQLDRKTQRAIKRTGKKMYCLAEDAYDNVLGYVK